MYGKLLLAFYVDENKFLEMMKIVFDDYYNGGYDGFVEKNISTFKSIYKDFCKKLSINYSEPCYYDMLPDLFYDCFGGDGIDGFSNSDLGQIVFADDVYSGDKAFYKLVIKYNDGCYNKASRWNNTNTVMEINWSHESMLDVKYGTKVGLVNSLVNIFGEYQVTKKIVDEYDGDICTDFSDIFSDHDIINYATVIFNLIDEFDESNEDVLRFEEPNIIEVENTVKKVNASRKVLDKFNIDTEGLIYTILMYDDGSIDYENTIKSSGDVNKVNLRHCDYIEHMYFDNSESYYFYEDSNKHVYCYATVHTDGREPDLKSKLDEIKKVVDIICKENSDTKVEIVDNRSLKGEYKYVRYPSRTIIFAQDINNSSIKDSITFNEDGSLDIRIPTNHY